MLDDEERPCGALRAAQVLEAARAAEQTNFELDGPRPHADSSRPRSSVGCSEKPMQPVTNHLERQKLRARRGIPATRLSATSTDAGR